MYGVSPFPLYWPLAHPRTRSDLRRRALFQVDFVQARTQLLKELDRLRAGDVVLSSNVPLRRDGLPAVPDREPDDPGVAVYFTRGGRPFVLACDAFERVRWNLRAIGATIEALRAIERHGSTSMLDQAFSGFAQLPASTARPWRDVLGFKPGPVTREQLQTVYRELARTHHPDRGGDPFAMAAVNVAYQQALQEVT
jgi:hypothetical protein